MVSRQGLRAKVQYTGYDQLTINHSTSTCVRDESSEHSLPARGCRCLGGAPR